MQFSTLKKTIFIKLRSIVATFVIILGATFGFGASVFTMGTNLFSTQDRIGTENSKIQTAITKGLFAAKQVSADAGHDIGCGTCACACTACNCGNGGPGF